MGQSVTTPQVDAGATLSFDLRRPGRIERGLLLCFSELHTKEEIDRLVEALAEMAA